MSDRERQQTTDDDAASPPETESDGGSHTSASGASGRIRDDDGDVRGLILRAALVVLGFVAVVALFQFYTSTVAVINEWVGREYRALFRAAFNLVVLLAAGIGISVVVRELTGADGGGA